MRKAKVLYCNPDVDTRLDRFELHAFIAPFPLVLLAGAFVADIASLYTVQTIWRPIAFWLLGLGLISGGIVAMIGIISFAATKAPRSLFSLLHIVGTTTALLLTCVNVALRVTAATPVVTWAQLVLSTVVFLLLLLSGWLVGELEFRDYARANSATA